MDYEKEYHNLLDKYDELMLEYRQLQKTARKWRKAKKRWKHKWISLSCRLANNTADLAEREEEEDGI